MNVHIFTADDIVTLQNKINKWLSKSNCDIISNSISYDNDKYIVLMTYKNKN